MLRDLTAVVLAATGVALVAAGVTAVVRRSRTRRALRAGPVMRGRVLEVSLLPGDQGRPGVPRSVVGFETPDGRQFLLVDRSGRARKVDEEVLVRCPAGRPEDAVLDDVRGGPAGPVAVLLAGAVVAAACLLVAVRVLILPL